MKKLLKALLISLTVVCLIGVTACGNGGSSSAHKPGAHYGTRDGVKILKSYVAEDGVDTFEVPQDVAEIKNNAFKDNASIKKIIIKSMDVEIGAGAFAGMKALEEIELSFVGAKVGAVNQAKTFAYIFGTESYDEGVAVTQTYNVSDETATYYVPATLKKVTVNPSSDYELPNYAFNGMSVLTSVTLGDKVISIGDAAFENCSALTKFVVPEAVTKIGDSAFVGCTGLRGGLGANETDSVIFKGDKVKVIGDKAFFASRLETVAIPNGVEVLGEYAFAAVEDVTSTAKSYITTVTLPDTLKTIGNYAFFKCEKLETVNFGTGIKDIKVGAFAYCTALQGDFVFADDVNVWAHAFGFLGNSSISVSGNLYDGWSYGTNMI